MKFSATGAALAAALIGAVSAKDERTFAVLRFTNKALTAGRMDPIVSNGQTSGHVHSVMGSSGFSKGATVEDLLNGKCTNALIKGDMSAYWFPSLYFTDPDSGNFESVDINYVNVYYFFEPTDDEIKAFPQGLKIVAGDAFTRTPPSSSATNLDPSKGDIMNVKWTCPRMDNNYNPPSWPADSNGKMAGIGDPINKGEGVGFPDVDCDGLYSPLRADVHMPSCYNPKAGLDNYQENMAWPEDNGSGKANCPEGYIHVPHLFFEVYWDTPAFKDRWTGGQGTQPFVLSNGDATGYSSHADFFAGWDEDILQNIIDTCDAGTLGMDNCPGITVNDVDCTIPSDVDEKIIGTEQDPLTALPGNNKLLGWEYGLAGLADLKNMPGMGGSPAAPSDSGSAPKPAPSKPAPSTAAAELPEDTAKPTNVVANVQDSKPEPAAANVQEPEPTVVVAPQPTAAAEVPANDAPANNGAVVNIETVWETVTMTVHARSEPTAVPESSNNATETVSGYQYAGCFQDGGERALSGAVRPAIGKVSNAKCVAHCKEAGFLLAGTESGGECYCGDELVGSKQLEESDCIEPCVGDDEDVCGGDWALSVYSESGEASIQSAKVRRHMHGHVHGHRKL